MKRLAILPFLALSAILLSQPPTTSWPTYHGDFTGRRFSPLTAINDKNIGNLATAWSFRTGGLGGSLKATPLMVDGVLYLTAPDHVWAIDAKTGKQIWHKAFETKGGWHIGNLPIRSSCQASPSLEADEAQAICNDEGRAASPSNGIG